MELWVLWLVIAGLLLISEIVFQWVWTLCLAIGCLAAMAAALADVSFLVQIVSLSAVSVVAYILLIPVLNRWQEKARRRNRNKSRTGMDALLGRVATVTNEIRPGNWGVRESTATAGRYASPAAMTSSATAKKLWLQATTA